MRFLKLFLFTLLLMTNVGAKGFKPIHKIKPPTTSIKPIKPHVSEVVKPKIPKSENGLTAATFALMPIGYALLNPNAKIHGNRNNIEND